MVLFKRIEIDLDKERARIDKPGRYNKRQRKALHKLVSLFEKGEWQKCLDHVTDEKQFPYNKRREYPEIEHVGVEIHDVLAKLSYENFYTQEELLKQAKEKLESSK